VTSRPPERIELDQLVLRRETLGDEDLIAGAVQENLDRLRPWMPWATPDAATSSTQRERLITVEQGWEARSDFTFLLLDAAESDLLGIFGLHGRIGPTALELGYWLSRTAEGKGYASAAAGALTEVTLELPDFSRVEIHCDEANIRSQRVPQRLGYRLDRIEPDEITAPGEIGRSMIWIYPP
jgi:RimJ/RimL family protein N-acetyltransferase